MDMNRILELTNGQQLAPEQLGEVLVKVQEDLLHLREQLIGQEKDGKVDISAVDQALTNTEHGIMRKTEQVLDQLQSQVRTLPSVNTQRISQQHMDARPVLKRSEKRSTDVEINMARLGQTASSQTQMIGLTPGQMAQQMRNLRALSNPDHSYNRKALNDAYGIQLPLLTQKPIPQMPNQGVVKGCTVEPLSVLPKANRINPQIDVPPIRDVDAQYGILSLVQRGLIPAAAHLTLYPSPVNHHPAALHPLDQKHMDKQSVPPAITDAACGFAGIKLDAANVDDVDSGLSQLPVVPLPQDPRSHTRRHIPSSKSTRSTKSADSKTSAPVKTFEMPLQPFPPPTTPTTGEQRPAVRHRFAIQNGETRKNTAEFNAFKQQYCLTWGSIVTTLGRLELLLANYAVPVAFIDGDRLADLAAEYELEETPSKEEFLGVFVNQEDIEAIVNQPGRRYKGKNGTAAAAIKIQSTWRRYVNRSYYLEYRRKKWAAGVIAISWIMTIKLSKVRHQLKQNRADQLEAYRVRLRKLALSWDRILMSRRVIIHIPSLGISQFIRDSINDFSVRQNTQMSRLCDIRDPNVDVIFVSPVPMNDETLQYYHKLLGLRPAIDSGNVEDQGEQSSRYRIIVPEAIKSFPTHRMCLSSILKYSPKTLKRIKALIKGREAYIIPGKPHKDDIYISDMLDVPLLGTVPDLAHLYSTKSGSKRVFASAGVAMPPSEYDIYSLQQLHECLAQLVTENLEVKRWLFKLDDEFDGRGIAYCDVSSHMHCYAWAMKEAQRYGDKWSKKWAQEAAYLKIFAELPDILAKHAIPVSKNVFPTWEKFLDSYLGQGGIIEACPPVESMTAISVDMFIDPKGQPHMLCCGDQIHAESPFASWGISVPQSSVDPHILNTACQKITQACKNRTIVGHFSIDFVTFIDPKTLHQQVWAIDLSMNYSDSVAMLQLMAFISKGVFNPVSHVFYTSKCNSELYQPKRRFVSPDADEQTLQVPSRYGVMSTRLLHTNLAVVHYSVFFQMCRAHGIGYDIREKQGTVFTLVDSINREKLGMLVLCDNLQSALATFARNMSVIHQEISAPNMQGETNFKGAIQDIECIIGTAIQNMDDQQQNPEARDKIQII